MRKEGSSSRTVVVKHYGGNLKPRTDVKVIGRVLG